MDGWTPYAFEGGPGKPTVSASVRPQHLPPIRGETERGGGRGRNAETHSGGAALTRLLGWPSVCLPRLYGATPIINHTLIG